MKSLLPLLLLCVLSSCSDRERKKHEGTELPRRVLRPAPERVLAMAPHNIHKSGMGPYKLGDELKTVLGLLPQGPRVELFGIEGLFNYSLVRAENGMLLLGVEPPSGVKFVSALSADVARTDRGIGVGTTRSELFQAFGEVEESLHATRDPRVLSFRKVPETRFVMQAERVQAVIVGGGLEEAASPSPFSCKRPDTLSANDIRDALKAPTAVVFTLCVAGKPAAVVAQGARVSLFGEENGKWRRLASHNLPDLSYVVPFDLDGDNNQEVAIVLAERTPLFLAARVRIYSFAGGRWEPVIDHPAYRLTAEAVGWVGAKLDEVDMLIELSVTGGRLWIGGLFLDVTGQRARNLVPLEPVEVPLPAPQEPPKEKKTVAP